MAPNLLARETNNDLVTFLTRERNRGSSRLSFALSEAINADETADKLPSVFAGAVINFHRHRYSPFSRLSIPLAAPSSSPFLSVIRLCRPPRDTRLNRLVDLIKRPEWNCASTGSESTKKEGSRASRRSGHPRLAARAT